jgi:hypothetical protein
MIYCITELCVARESLRRRGSEIYSSGHEAVSSGVSTVTMQTTVGICILKKECEHRGGQLDTVSQFHIGYH